MGNQFTRVKCCVCVCVCLFQDFRVFSRAWLCACCPILTAPELVDDHNSVSPLLSTSSSTAVLPSLSRKRSSYRRVRSTSFDGRRSTCEDLCLVSVEALRELVCRAFGLSKERVAEYQRLVFQPHRKKQDAKIIAEDLLYLLSLLERCKHPYYAPDKFLVCIIFISLNFKLHLLPEKKHISS